ncbi:ribosomal protein S2 [Patellaria atrata CBS 101060]|uniref:Ribosomal protein S2 n=1 Tax=Patellaria atrata CBS 101060 TaxID=1346257 RepID=A0A9P4S9R3_9PEZI|nr:ribosomal protein S2 [Patellaria atrata CBS 101060]
MIIRRSLLRQGCRALQFRGLTPYRRFLSSEIDGINTTSDSLIDTQVLASREAEETDPGPRDTFAAQNYENFKHQQQMLGKLGSIVEPHYQPHTLVNNPPRPSEVTLELLLASQAHLGHSTSLWNPANARYIFGIREGVHIISLDVTAAHLRRAAKVVREVARRGGLILFVGTRPGQDRCVVKAAELAEGCHLFERWIPGTITNGQQILGKCTMKVVDEFDREVKEFEDQIADRPVLKPDLVICLNPIENYILLHECGLNGIPTIGIIDTDANPTWVTYPIPANDDSLRCVQVIAGVLGRAGEEGQKLRKEAAANGHITFNPARNLEMPDKEKIKEVARRRTSGLDYEEELGIGAALMQEPKSKEDELD